MRVIINGQPNELEADLNVQQMLEHFGLNPEITIVEKNRKILERGDYAGEIVEENDSFELIRYMGGG